MVLSLLKCNPFLQRDMNYEVLVVAFNSQGESPPSAPITVYVGEAVPTGKPKNVNAEPVTSTEIRVTWEVSSCVLCFLYVFLLLGILFSNSSFFCKYKIMKLIVVIL